MPVATAEGTTTARFAEERPGRGATLSATRPAVDLSPAVTKRRRGRRRCARRREDKIAGVAWGWSGRAMGKAATSRYGAGGLPVTRRGSRARPAGEMASADISSWRRKTQDLDDGKHVDAQTRSRSRIGRECCSLIGCRCRLEMALPSKMALIKNRSSFARPPPELGEQSLRLRPRARRPVPNPHHRRPPRRRLATRAPTRLDASDSQSATRASASQPGRAPVRARQPPRADDPRAAPQADAPASVADPSSHRAAGGSPPSAGSELEPLAVRRSTAPPLFQSTAPGPAPRALPPPSQTTERRAPPPAAPSHPGRERGAQPRRLARDLPERVENLGVDRRTPGSTADAHAAIASGSASLASTFHGSSLIHPATARTAASCKPGGDDALGFCGRWRGTRRGVVSASSLASSRMTPCRTKTAPPTGRVARSRSAPARPSSSACPRRWYPSPRRVRPRDRAC